MRKTILLTAFIALGLAGCNSKPVEQAATQSSADAVAANPAGLHAEDKVVMRKDAFGCEAEHNFHDALVHLVNKEYSAYTMIVMQQPQCFMGASLKSGQEFTVLEVHGSVMRIAVTTAAQYSTGPELSNHTYWTFASWGMRAPGA